MQLNLGNILILLLLICASCEDKITLQLPELKHDTYAIYGIITNELENVEITVHKLSKNTPTSPLAISNATVYIESVPKGIGQGQKQTIACSEDTTQPGTYTTNIKTRAVLNKSYTLHVLIDTMHITATADMGPITAMPELAYYPAPSQNGMYRLPRQIWSQEQAMWELYLDWNSTQTCDTCYARTYLYTLNSVDVGQMLAPKKQEIEFPSHTKIIRKKYSLSDHHAEFIRGVLLETQWNGGYFDEQPANPTTNLSHGAVGYWGACMVLSDTIVVQ